MNQFNKKIADTNNETGDLKKYLKISIDKIASALTDENKLKNIKVGHSETDWYNFFIYDEDRDPLESFLIYRIAGAFKLYESGYDDCDVTDPVIAYFKALLLSFDDVDWVKSGPEIDKYEKKRVFLIGLKYGESFYLETDTANSLMTDLNSFFNLIVKKVENLPNNANWPHETYIKKYNLKSDMPPKYYTPFKYIYYCDLLPKLSDKNLNNEEFKCLQLLRERAKRLHTLTNMMLVPYGYNRKRGYILTTYKTNIKINDSLALTWQDYTEMIEDQDLTDSDLQQRLGNKKCSVASIRFLIKHGEDIIPRIPTKGHIIKKSIEDICNCSRSIISSLTDLSENNDIHTYHENPIDNAIAVFEKGISLKEFLNREDEFKIDGKTDIYNKYGRFVIYNKTKNVFTVGGTYSIGTNIHQFFETDKGRGNPYMHKHFMDGDDIEIKFFRFESDDSIEFYEFEKTLERKYKSFAESYIDYMLRVNGTKEDVKSSSHKSNNNRAATVNRSKSSKLLEMRNDDSFIYSTLRLILDLTVKPLPVFYMLFRSFLNNTAPHFLALYDEMGFTTLFKAKFIIKNGITIFCNSVLIYIVVIFTIFIFKLLVFKKAYPLMRFRILDIILNLLYGKPDNQTYNKAHSSNYSFDSNSNNFDKDSKKAYQNERTKEKLLSKLEFSQKELERNEEEYELNMYHAKRLYKSASDGTNALQSKESKLKEAAAYEKKAEWNRKNIKQEKRIIADLQRKLNKL